MDLPDNSARPTFRLCKIAAAAFHSHIRSCSLCPSFHGGFCDIGEALLSCAVKLLVTSKMEVECSPVFDDES